MAMMAIAKMIFGRRTIMSATICWSASTKKSYKLSANLRMKTSSSIKRLL
jgi:hypothetical protein